jgi:GNAT superfamily N-acetyltransferase
MEQSFLELTEADSRYFADLRSAQKTLLPDFDWLPQNMVRISTDDLGRPRVQILLAILNGGIAGFIQANYIYFGDACFLNIDFFAVLPECRKHGCALALLREVRRRAGCDRRVRAPILGILGLAEAQSSASDPLVERRLRLYAGLGAQIRRDLLYKTPDYPTDFVVWYPLLDSCSALPTVVLAWVLWSVSQYTHEQFRQYVSQVDPAELEAHIKLRDSH